MNRIIKFRARRIDNDRWVYGRYFCTPLTDENSGADIKDGCFFLCGEKRHCIEQDGVSFVIKLETLGQFTGLKDKNGREIYESDIVKWSDNFTQQDSIIIYDDQCGGFRLSSVYTCGFKGINLQKLEVIGNTFENSIN